MEVVEILAWPIAAILIALIIVLLLRNSLSDILKRISKINYGKIEAEVSQIKQEKSDKSIFEQEKIDKPTEHIEKALGIFSRDTLERSQNLVETESKVKEIQDSTKKAEVLLKYAQAIYLILSFERIYNTIFGSQLLILDYVNTDSDQTKADLKRFYDNAKEKYPALYESYSYDDYFNFLISFELIVLNENNTYSITWMGRDLLKFLVETGKTLNKRY